MYIDVPVPEKDNVTKTLAVTSAEALNSCCVIEMTRWQPRVINDSIICSRCRNLLRSVECDSGVENISVDLLTMKQHVTLRKGYAVQMVAYDHYFWNEARSEDDIKTYSFLKEYGDTFEQLSVFPQHSLDAFVEDTLQTVSPQLGKILVLGKLKENWEELDKNISALENTDNWFTKIL